MSPFEIRHTGSGKAVGDLRIGCGTQKAPVYIDCTVWGELAEDCSRIQEGETIAVIARLAQDTWEKDGQKRSKIKLVASSVVSESRFHHETREKMRGPSGPAPTSSKPVPPPTDDFPF
jgi:single-strand DNA-binding protein